MQHESKGVSPVLVVVVHPFDLFELQGVVEPNRVQIYTLGLEHYFFTLQLFAISDKLLNQFFAQAFPPLSLVDHDHRYVSDFLFIFIIWFFLELGAADQCTCELFLIVELVVTQVWIVDKEKVIGEN